MITIASGTSSFNPASVTTWATSQTSRNVIHDIIGRADPDVTLKPASSRAGTLEMLFTSQSGAETARGILSKLGVFTITTADPAWLNGFKFVIQGEVAVALDSTTQNAWVLTAGFKEVIL